MVSLSFSSFMLFMLLFIFLTIKDTIVHTDDQVKQMVHEAENDNARMSHLSVEKGNERDSMNSASTHNSKNDDQSDDNGSFQNLESEKFQDDATDFFTTNKDYVPVSVTNGD
ncbi:uncharacterized protein LOC107014014 isoform X2 [Solanum pennellii]|uniref:Uncharacterized protein LOC107014014 isoform X2 n=1 Tax=Solanum pennellii TaxID=28526 RepID=A0ABM1V6C1_SOLPN|nr:uncharacterized protein LOC107014014 isoform X2 [Solanum pennellii]